MDAICFSLLCSGQARFATPVLAAAYPREAGRIYKEVVRFAPEVVADRGHSSYAFREHVWNLGAQPAIPPKMNEAPTTCPAWIYNNRNRVERIWARLKEWRAVATRHEKTASSFLGVPQLAATLDWIRH